MHSRLLILLVLLSVSSVQAQQPVLRYDVNSSLKKIIDTGAHLPAAYEEWRKFENDSALYDTYGKKRSVLSPVCRRFGDTVFVLLESGLLLKIFKDSYIIEYKAQDTFIEVPGAESDSTAGSISSNMIPCKHQSLVLLRKPAFKTGEVIDGIVAFESRAYKDLKQEYWKTYREQFNIYFSIRVPEIWVKAD